MSKENRLWGASRIHGELLMLGFQIAQSTVSKYMVRYQNPPSQTWKTFLRNHAEAIAAIDMVRRAYGSALTACLRFLVAGPRPAASSSVGRGDLLHPTAAWLARQITEAFPWTSAPAYLVRDNDGCLRARLHVPGEGHGDSRPADLAGISVAERRSRNA